MAKEQHFAKPTTGVKMPGGAGLFEEEKAITEQMQGDQASAYRIWRDIPAPPDLGRYGAAPYDHAHVLLTSDGEDQHAAKWQITRRILKGKWEPFGFWAARDSGGRAVGFEPLGWRELVE